ncbi:GRAM domain-containing protein 1B [Toxocara canis]|uniref:GRAM domain-containing protein 1B n=1 Tax=Toxocara canis TaxID=6265 RepID=A0A0B2VRL8_TOXCA|nr:GRAM domain-containing protein 1B [Toxocara canis]
MFSFQLVIRPVEKRFHRFQQLFGKIVGEADELIAAYSCAFQSRILSQGHLYVSQRNISFYSNSLSWETQFIIPFSKVTKISKQKTAKVLPNAVLIETCDEERYLFTCFTQRDKSFTLLLYVWQSSIDGASIVPADLWKLRCTPDGRLDSSSSKLGSASPWGTSPRSLQRMPETIVSPKNSVSSITDSAVGCSDSNLMRNSSACLLDSKHSGVLNESSDEESNISEGDLSNESKVSCPCRSHLGRVLLDDVFRLTAQQLFTILFSEIPWYQQFADIVKQTAQSRLFDSISGYAASPWITGHSGVTSSTRTATYTMALNHAMAPKSTVITEKQVCMELEQLSDGFVVTTESQNAGIPYADSFLIQCKYCVTRVDSTHSRLLIHGGIIYKKSIWGIVRGYIEKSTYAGLEDHYAALDETLKVHCERNADAPSCSLDDNLCMQRFNTTHFASLTFQPSSSIPFLKRRGSGHETDASTFNTRVNTNVTSTSSRGLPMRSRAITEDTQTQTLPVVQTPHLTYYVRLIITLLTTLILLHVCTLLKLWSTETPQRCHTNHHVAHMLAGNADSLAVADLMRFDPTEKTQSQVAEFRRTIDQVPQTKLTEIREIWRRTDEP